LIIKKISQNYYEIEVIVREIIFGNTTIDRFIGWDEVEATTLKLRCEDCTVMVFKSDIKYFKNIENGFRFKALVSVWKENIYTFKKFLE